MSHIPAIHRGSVLLWLTFVLVALADQFFYHAPVGWTAAAFSAALLIVLLVRSPHPLRAWPGRILALASILLIIAMLIEPGFLEFTLTFIFLTALIFTARHGWSISPDQWARRYLNLLTAWLRPFRDMAVARHWLASHRARHPSFQRFLIRWAVPVALTILFIFLLRQANPIIENFLHRIAENISRFLTNISDYLAPARIFFWCCTALALWSLFRLRCKFRRRGITPPPLPDARSPLQFVTTDLVVRCLILFNLLFAAQTIMDLLYLWQHAALPDGLTYAQYAHRGAYPLVITALLAGFFVLIAFRRTGPAHTSPAARRLVYLWLAQNILLMLSAIRRLSLYIDAYSLSRWRIAAAIWMAVVGIALLLTIIRIVTRRDNAWLIRTSTLVAAVICIVCTFLPIDRIIADFNVRHCSELSTADAPLDIAYLQHLGHASLPALLWFAQNTSADVDSRRLAFDAAAEMQSDLRQTLADWRGWTIRRAQLAALPDAQWRESTAVQYP